MVSSFTTGRAHLEKPARGDDVDAWDTPVVANFDVTDACFSATTSIAVTTGVTTLTQPQMRCQRVVVTGSLSGNVNLNFFAGVAGFYVASNATTPNGFTVTLGQNAGTTVVIPSGSLHTLVYVDGTNVVAADAGSATAGVPPGALQDFAMSTAPSGWLVCDGSAISRTTFSALFVNIGTVFGSGNGSTTFNIPNLYGLFRRTWDQGGSVDPGRGFGSFQADAFPSHNHTINDPAHSHSYTAPATGQINQGSVPTFPPAASTSSGTTSSDTTGITINSAGSGSETRVKNRAFLTCIKT